MLKHIIAITALALTSATISAEQTQTEPKPSELRSTSPAAGADTARPEMTCMEDGVPCSPERARMRLDEARAAAAGKPSTPANASTGKPGSDPGGRRVETVTCMEDGVECSPEVAKKRLDEARDAARKEALESGDSIDTKKPPTYP
jgi:hypothetical protein